jgi:hypothetical protein
MLEVRRGITFCDREHRTRNVFTHLNFSLQLNVQETKRIAPGQATFPETSILLGTNSWSFMYVVFQILIPVP